MKSNKKYSKEQIISTLKKTKYSSRYKIYDTCLDQNEIRWKYGKRTKYENKLKEDGLKFFAFIKFYLDKNGNKIGLVAGKSGSRNVISRSDLNFSTNPKHGEARQFLKDNHLSWCQTEVLIIGAIENDYKMNRKEAFRIESQLKDWFNLKER